jgi:hypothetical protein
MANYRATRSKRMREERATGEPATVRLGVQGVVISSGLPSSLCASASLVSPAALLGHGLSRLPATPSARAGLDERQR